jgi:hypothetical protein
MSDALVSEHLQLELAGAPAQPVGATPQEAAVVVKIDELNGLRTRLANMAAEQQTAIDDLLGFDLDIKRQVDAVRATFATQTADLAAQAKLLEEAIKAQTLLIGHTVKGGDLQCVWSKPSAKWNDDKLTGYATAHPEILAFHTVGKPSVAIR